MKSKVTIVICIVMIIIGASSCSSSSSSSYQLHDKDGDINWDYYNDMQDYFEKHPEKLP